MSSNSNNLSLFDKAQRWLTRPFSDDQFSVYAESHRSIRPENQDNYLVIHPSGEAAYLMDEQAKSETLDWSQDWCRLVVADGMGGHDNGRQASEQLVTLLKQESPTQDVTELREKVYQIHAKLYKQFAHAGGKNAGSTLVWVDIHVSGLVMVANVGDSRLYHAKEGQLWQPKTHDHHREEFEWREQVKQGQTTEAAPQVNTNKIAQAMAFGSYGLIANDSGYRPKCLSERLYLELESDLPEAIQDHADVFSFYLEKGDSLLLTSDGLWSGSGEFVFPNGQALLDQSVFSKSVQNCVTSATDNTTAILWRSL